MSDSYYQLDRLRHSLTQNPPAIISGLYPEAAVMVAIIQHQFCPELLLTRRAKHMKIHPGEAAFPGGKQDPADTSLLVTALREAEEEVALCRDNFEYWGCLDQRVTRTGIKVTPFVGTIPEAHSLQPNLDEVDSIYTVPLEFFVEPGRLIIEKVEYQGRLRHIPRFNYQQHSIWGVTAMIVVDLVNRVYGAGIEVNQSDN